MIIKGKVYFYISCSSAAINSDGLGENGVDFLFADGTKRTFTEAKIKVKYIGRSFETYRYSSDIELSNEDMQLFLSKPIQAYRLYSAEKDVDSESSFIYKSYINCIVKNH